MSEKNSERIVSAAREICSALIPDDVLEQLEEGYKSEDKTLDELLEKKQNLFSLNTMLGKVSISLEVSSQHKKVKGIIIGKGGKNIEALRHILQVIGNQEKFNVVNITVT